MSEYKITNKIDDLPEPLREFFISEEKPDGVLAITVDHHIPQEKAKIIVWLTAQIVLGVIHPEDLSKEISKKTSIDKRVADNVASEIIRKVLASVAKDLNDAYKFHMEVPVIKERYALHESATVDSKLPIPPMDKLASAEINEGASPQTEKISYSEAKPPIKNPLDAPTVLHQHEGLSNKPDENGYPGGLVRPSFYEPPGGISSEEVGPQARLEIGSSPQESIQPITRVGKEDANIVHYSTPDTPVDPFRAPVTPQPPKEKKAVPESNVVNLKDLPK